ncbi:MAG: zinc-ribbon domain-containing protein [Desulfobacteraceae bacterium]
MKVICPNCNKGYNIADGKVPKTTVKAKCKSCDQIMVIEPSGIVWADAPVTSPPPSGFEGAGVSAGHAVLMDYPELQSISPDRVMFEEILSPNKKGGYKSMRNKLKVKVLMAVSEVLDKALNEGEKVMRIGKGTAYYPAELFFGNGWLTMMYNHYAILATNQRLLFINVNSRMKRRTHYLFQILYEDIKKLKRGILGSMTFTREKSKRRVFTNVKRFMSKELKSFIMERKEYAMEEPEEVLENICPSCFVPLQKGLKVCPSCKAAFKEPKKASLRSLLLPGLGDFYLGHRALGIMELIGSLVIWSYALLLILSGQKEGLFIGVFLLLFYNSMDGALTYFMAKKGYMLA